MVDVLRINFRSARKLRDKAGLHIDPSGYAFAEYERILESAIHIVYGIEIKAILLDAPEQYYEVRFQNQQDERLFKLLTNIRE